MSDKASFVIKKITCDGGISHNDKCSILQEDIIIKSHSYDKANTWEKIIIFMISIKFSYEIIVDWLIYLVFVSSIYALGNITKLWGKVK